MLQASCDGSSIDFIKFENTLPLPFASANTPRMAKGARRSLTPSPTGASLSGEICLMHSSMAAALSKVAWTELMSTEFSYFSMAASSLCMECMNLALFTDMPWVSS